MVGAQCQRAAIVRLCAAAIECVEAVAERLQEAGVVAAVGQKPQQAAIAVAAGGVVQEVAVMLSWFVCESSNRALQHSACLEP